MSEQTDKKPVEAPKPIEFGKIRERVKKGELDPHAVLDWLRDQEYVSEELVKFLRHKAHIIVHAPTPSKKEGDKKKKGKKRKKENDNVA